MPTKAGCQNGWKHVTHGNSSDANIRDTGAETLATAGRLRTLTAEKNNSNRRGDSSTRVSWNIRRRQQQGPQN